MMMNSKPSLGLHNPLNSGGLPGRYSPPYRSDTMRRLPNSSVAPGSGLDFLQCRQGNLFLDDSMLARVEALAAVDISKNTPTSIMKHDSIYGHAGDMSSHSPTSGVNRHHQVPLHGFGAPPTDSMLDQISAAASMPLSMAEHNNMITSHSQMYSPVYSHPQSMHSGGPHPGLPNPHTMHHTMHDLDCDPRELEAFAERFKQRRIKLGVTQADVGNALGNLKLPGVGSLSQSTICRFESLTLSHNNMIALKPVLQAWLEEAERHAREAKEAGGMMGAADKKRKRTSIAAPEKRSLEAYFAVQPRPSGEKIAQIAEKLDLKKNVVRVWFCNQRQKQKRMKFSAVNH